MSNRKQPVCNEPLSPTALGMFTCHKCGFTSREDSATHPRVKLPQWMMDTLRSQPIDDQSAAVTVAKLHGDHPPECLCPACVELKTFAEEIARGD